MFIKHTQKCLCVQASVLHVFYGHVPFSMYPQHEPQPHFEVQRGCGCSPVGVGFQHMAVAKVLGTSDLANTVCCYCFRAHGKHHVLI